MNPLTKGEVPMADQAAAKAAIEVALSSYEAALNTADIEAILGLFAEDGVFMAPNRPTTIGKAAIGSAYDSIFQVIAFDTRLHIEEIVPVAPDWGFARTSSRGYVTLKADGKKIPDANHELFVFQRSVDNSWKIARYSFATTNPPQ